MEKLLLILFIFLIFSCKNKENTDSDYLQKIELEKKERLLFSIGKTYFEKNCISCHKLGAKGISNLDYSFKSNNFSMDFLSKFITKQDSLTKSENEEAAKILEFFGDIYNHNFKFNEEETKSIIYYIKSQKSN
ncbi:c-type cytochrome [Flavobacterium enshiense]|uniref:c-type cytochrome n=1 Tax=Flavobacterium enshiense TaxID=1341165 RepID=UPI00345D1A52